MNIGTLTGSIELDDNTSAVLARVDKGLTNLSRAFDETGAASARFESSMTLAAAAGSFLGNILSNVVTKVISFTTNLITGSVMAGLRLEQLGVATRFLGEKAGYTGTQIDALSRDIERTGISGIAAREAIQSLLSANVDLAYASRLSMIAQNMQSISGRTSSEVFQVLTRAIATGNTQLLRNIGFQNISIEGMKRQQKELTGVSHVMTGAQRSTAILNAIMAEGEKMSGLYGVSMETAGKQAGSASRAWDQVAENIGTILLPITSIAMKSWFALGEAVRDSVAEAGSVVTPFVSLVATGFQSIIDSLARLQPAIISIKDIIVDVINWLVAFNERWQITSNIALMAQVVWGFLEKAFNLVKVAVEAVIRAWQSMPDWLQRITKTALEGSLALAAYSVVIAGVATPLRVLMGTISTAIGIFGNFAGGIMSTMVVWPKFTGMIVTLGNTIPILTARVWLLDLSLRATAITTQSVMAAKVLFGGVLTALGNTMVIQTARMWLMELSLRASAVTTRVLTAAKALLSGVIVTLGNSVLLATARNWLMNASLVATAGSAKLAAAGFGVLGTALLAIQAIPIVLILSGIAFGIYKVVGAINDFLKSGKGFFDFLHNTRDYDNWLRRGINAFTQWAAGVDVFETSVTKLKDAATSASEDIEAAMFDIAYSQFRGDDLVERANTLDKSLAKLNAEKEAGTIGAKQYGVALQRLADSATMLIQQGGELSAEMQGIHDWLGKTAVQSDVLVAGFDHAVDAMKRIKDEALEGRSAFDEFTESMERMPGGVLRMGHIRGPGVPDVPDASPPEVDPAAVKAAEEQAKRINSLISTFSGADLVQKIKEVDIALTRMGGASALTSTELSRVTDAAVKLWKEGGTLTPQLAALANVKTKIREELQKLVPVLAVNNAQWQNIGQVMSGLTPEAYKMVQQLLGVGRALELHTKATALHAAFMHLRTSNLLTAAALKMTTDAANALSMAGARLSPELMHLVTAGGALQKGLPPDFFKKLGNEIEIVIPQVRQTVDVTKELVDGFVALAQIGGPAFSAIGRAVQQSFAQFRTGRAVHDQFKKSFLDLAAASRGQARQEALVAAARVRNFGIATPLFSADARAGERWASGIASAAAVANGAMEAYAAGANSANKASAALNGALSGAQAGAAFGPWGAAIGALGGAVLGFIARLNAGRRAVKEFAATFAELGVSGFTGLRTELLRLGDAGEQLWINLTQRVPRGDTAAAEAAINAIRTALAALDADIQRYNLTWSDMADAQSGGMKAGDALAASFKRLIDAGYSVSSVIRGMADDLNKYIIDSIRAGVKIPPSMRPIIEHLIRTRNISIEAARAMLGLADAAIPSLADIKAAADRYGITLDELGGKVKQLEITELANQYVADWEILTAATDDWGVLFDKMGPKVQSLILDAMKYGAELPAAMRPMIQAWIEAGQLVDENGEALTDLSRLTFAADLEEMFESLILKLDELIDTIVNGVGGALTGLGNIVVHPRVVPVYDGSNVPDNFGPSEPAEPIYRSTGGIVPSASQNVWKPKGTDTVRAMLTPGEIVLNAAQQESLAKTVTTREQESSKTSKPMNVYINSRLISRELVEDIHREVNVRVG